MDKAEPNSHHQEQHTVATGSRVVARRCRDRRGRRDGRQSQRLGGGKGGHCSSSSAHHGSDVLRNWVYASGRNGQRSGRRESGHRRGRAVVRNRSHGDSDGSIGRSCTGISWQEIKNHGAMEAMGRLLTCTRSELELVIQLNLTNLTCLEIT